MNATLALLTVCCAVLVAAEPSPTIIAHRGASGYLPEHTLAAKALAYAQGADYLEQDLVLTKDGVPIVQHDVTLDSTTDVASRFPGRQRANGSFYAIDFTLAEVRQLRVLERFNPKTGKACIQDVFPLVSVSSGLILLRKKSSLSKVSTRARDGRSVSTRK